MDWTHPSVTRVVAAGAGDPYAWVVEQAQDLALRAMDNGWTGPPYDAFALADALGIEVVARQDLDDARLVEVKGRPRIEFNPQRRAARVRFSVAHEIGHTLFEDWAGRERFRDADQRRGDDWQLEVLCNIAAAELVMPAGAFASSDVEALDLVRLLDERSRLGVSTEALLRRIVRITRRAASMFAAARIDEDHPRFRIDYVAHSRSWRAKVNPGAELESDVLSACTAVGYSDHGSETWLADEVFVQAVGIPPYPGDRFPRIVGLVCPAADIALGEPVVRYVRGDATDPRPDGHRVVAHVVNDRAQHWGPRGFARDLADRYPDSYESYAAWDPKERVLGAVHTCRVGDDLSIASLVAQSGYGARADQRPRVRPNALRRALKLLREDAERLDASVHMPLIGTGQGGLRWPVVRDLIVEVFGGSTAAVTVYVLPGADLTDDLGFEAEQLSMV